MRGVSPSSAKSSRAVSPSSFRIVHDRSRGRWNLEGHWRTRRDSKAAGDPRPGLSGLVAVFSPKTFPRGRRSRPGSGGTSCRPVGSRKGGKFELRASVGRRLAPPTYLNPLYGKSDWTENAVHCGRSVRDTYYCTVPGTLLYSLHSPLGVPVPTRTVSDMPAHVPNSYSTRVPVLF